MVPLFDVPVASVEAPRSGVIAGAAGETRYKYKAFMSYSHAADHALAPRLQGSLQQFAKPFWQLRSIRIFRDQTTLSATPHLWADIQKALDQSEYFILLASSASAQSRWVNQEIEYWLKTRGTTDKLLIVRTDGEITWDDGRGDFSWPASSAVPQALKGTFSAEPKWEDVSDIRRASDLTARNPILDSVTASLYSTMVGKPLDEVIGDDVAHHRTTRITVWSTSALILAMTVGVYLAGARALNERARVLSSQSEFLAERSHQFMKLKSFERGVLTSLEAVPDPKTCNERPRVESSVWALREAVAGHALNMQVRHTLKHNGQVFALASNRDGTRLATGAADGMVRVFDTATWTVLAAFKSNNQSVLSVSFSPDDTRIIVSGGDKGEAPSKDNVIRLWDWENSQLLHEFPQAAHVRAAAFNVDGSRILTAAANTASIFDAVTFEKVHELAGHSAPVMAATWSPDGSSVATASKDGTVLLWSAASGQPLLAAPLQHGARVDLVRFMPDGKKLLTASGDRVARVWTVADGTLAFATRPHAATIRGIAVSSTGRFVATASVDRTARVIDAATGIERDILREHVNQIEGALFGPEDRLFVAWSADGTADIWDIKARKRLALLRGHRNTINALVLLNGGRTVLTASDDETVRVWAPAPEASGITMQSLPQSASGVSNAAADVAFSADGQHVVMASWNHTASVFDVHTGELLASLEGHTAPVLTARFSPDGTTVATGSGYLDGTVGTDNSVRIWDWRNRTLLRTIAHPGRVRTVEFSPDGARIASAVGDGTAAVWSLAQPEQPLQVLKGHREAVTSVAWSPDGKLLATASVDHTARLFDTATGEELSPDRPFQLSDKVFGVTWLVYKGEDVIATASGDHAVSLWRPSTRERLLYIDDQVDGDGEWFERVRDMDGDTFFAVTNTGAVRIWQKDGREIARFQVYDNSIEAADWQAKNRTLAIATLDGGGRIIDLGTPIDQLVANARRAVPRKLDLAERVQLGLGAETVDRCRQAGLWDWVPRLL
jgi:WD40 repeat protein